MIDEAKLDAMLIGHIWLPLIFKDQKPLPSSMEASIVSDLLIDKLGFKGLIVSDDMTMKAITNAYGLGEACVRAFLAGIDLILVCGTYQQSLEAVEAIAAAIDSGRISQDPQNFLENRRENFLRFSGVVFRVSRFSMMSLKDQKAVSTHCGSASERGAYSACVLR